METQELLLDQYKMLLLALMLLIQKKEKKLFLIKKSVYLVIEIVFSSTFW